MACEFLGHEYKPDKDRTLHERVFCTANGEGCLCDDPLGYIHCTRRTFLLLQGATPNDKPVSTKPQRQRKGKSAQQYVLF